MMVHNLVLCLQTGELSSGMSMTPKNDIQTTQGIAGYVPIVSKLGYRFCQP